MGQKKIKVIIDSDVSNEIDDQFAISYVFSNQDKLDVLAITIAPFRVSWQKDVSVRDGLIDSRSETYRLLRLFGVKYDKNNPMVFMGCDGFISEGYNSSNPAVEKIIQLAKEVEDLHFCCLGTLTNVAMALKIAPEIAEKLKIVWLGTDNILLDEFTDSNFRKDKQAFYDVLKSNVDFTIFPSSLARCLVTSKYEFLNNTKSNNVVKYLQSLLNRFEHIEENLGKKEVFDIGPVAYLLFPEKFFVKDVDSKLVVKDKGVRIPKNRKVHYVVSMPKHFEVWEDFLRSINSAKNFYIKPQIFFTSDTHFNQLTKVTTKQVPFENVDEMNDELVRRWNNVVSYNDTVYHLGDFGDYDFIKKLNGRVILICGNYEKRDYKVFEKFRQKLLNLGFADVIENGMYLDEKVLGRKVYLTHKPTDHAKDCLTLFGHVHSLAVVKPFGFNVACTYHNFTPITAKKVKYQLNFVAFYADGDVFS